MEEKLTAGQSFVKSIRPAGCALFLILAVLVAVLCLTAGRDPIPGYTPPERASYENDLSRLVEVLEEHRRRHRGHGHRDGDGWQLFRRPCRRSAVLPGGPYHL